MALTGLEALRARAGGTIKTPTGAIETPMQAAATAVNATATPQKVSQPVTLPKAVSGLDALRARSSVKPAAAAATSEPIPSIAQTTADHNAVIAEKPMGLVQSIAQGIAKPFIRTALTGAAGLDFLTQKLPGGKAPSANARDFGYFGKQKPVTSVPDAIGVGLEVGSYFIGAGEASAGLKALAIGGAKIGATQAAGSYLQKEDGRSVLGFAGATVTGGALGGAFGVATGAVGRFFQKGKAGGASAVASAEAQAEQKTARTLIDDAVKTEFEKPAVQMRQLEAGTSVEKSRTVLDEMRTRAENLQKSSQEIESIAAQRKAIIEGRVTAAQAEREAAVGKATTEVKKAFGALSKEADALAGKPLKIASKISNLLVRAKVLNPMNDVMAVASKSERVDGYLVEQAINKAKESAPAMLADGSLTGNDARKLSEYFKQFDEVTARTKEVTAQIQDPRGLHKTIVGPVEAKFAKKLSEVQSGDVASLNTRVAKLRTSIAEDTSRIAYLNGTKEADQLRLAIKEGLTPQDVFRAKGRQILDPVLVNEVKNVAPLPNTFGTTFMEPRRVARTQGGTSRAIQRALLDPASTAQVASLAARKVSADAINEMARKAGLKQTTAIGRFFSAASRQLDSRNKAVFDALDTSEGWANASKTLSKEEMDFASYVKSFLQQKGQEFNDMQVARGKPEEMIDMRNFYMPHVNAFSALKDLGREVFGQAEIDAQITAASKASRSFGFSEERIGGAGFMRDPLYAVLRYSDAVESAIHLNPVGDMMYGYAEHLPDAASRNYWKKWISEGVLGAKTTTDKAVDEFFQFPVSDVARMFTRLTGRGTILGSVSTTALQGSTALLSVSKSGFRHGIAAAKGILTGDGLAFATTHSKVMQMRELGPELLASDLGNLEKKIGWLNGYLDKQMVAFSFNSFYKKAVADLGMNHEAAVKFADELTANTQAAYGPESVPPILRSKIGRVFAQFQTFTFNLFNQVTTDSLHTMRQQGAGAAGVQLMKLMGAMYATNMGFELIGLPTPYDFLKSGKHSLIVPLVGSTSLYGEPIVPKTFHAVFDLVFGSPAAQRTAIATLKKEGPLFIPMGNQIHKTLAGAQAASRGYVTVGKKKIPIGTTSKISAVLFGPSGTPESQAEYAKLDAEARKQRNAGIAKLLTGK